MSDKPQITPTEVPTPMTEFFTLVDNYKPERPCILVCGCPVVPAAVAAGIERNLHSARQEVIALRGELRNAEANLAIIGEIAVMDFDNETVGKVDGALRSSKATYKDRLMQFGECMKTHEQVKAQVTELSAKLEQALIRAATAEEDARMLREDARKNAEWTDQAKRDWGVSTNISFDVVWAEALQMKRPPARIPCTLYEAARKDSGTVSLIHQVDAEACCKQIADLQVTAALAHDMAACLSRILNSTPKPGEDAVLNASCYNEAAALLARHDEVLQGKNGRAPKPPGSWPRQIGEHPGKSSYSDGSVWFTAQCWLFPGEKVFVAKAASRAEELVQRVEEQHFRSAQDTGANPKALTVWNALRRELGMDSITMEVLEQRGSRK